MKASHLLKLKALENKTRFSLCGVMKGSDVGEVVTLYNLHNAGHRLNGSTITAETIQKEGLKKLNIKETL